MALPSHKTDMHLNMLLLRRPSNNNNENWDDRLTAKWASFKPFIRADLSNAESNELPRRNSIRAASSKYQLF